MDKILAVVSNERELSAVIEQAGTSQLTVLCHSFFPQPRTIENLSLITPDALLSEKDKVEIEERTAFFARNWYSFDKKFEQETIFDGIAIGRLHENDLTFIFKTNFILIAAILKSLETKPDRILANRNSFVGEALRVVAKAKAVGKIEFFDLPVDRAFSRLPNISRKKVGEIRRNISKILPDLFTSRNSGKTVFVRGRRYIGNIEQELRKDSDLNVVSLDEFLLKTFLNPINLYKYISIRARMRKKFHRIFEEFKKSRAFEERFVFRGVNFGKMFALTFPQFVKRDWPEFVFLIDVLSKLFKSKKPKAVVLWADTVVFERICVLLAKKYCAKSLVLQHGLMWKISKGGDWIRGFAPLTADYIAVWGEKFKKMLVEKKVPANKILVTGSPRLDTIHNKEFDTNAMRKKIGPAKGEKVVVFAPELSADVSELKKAINAVKELGNTKLVLKLHPIADAKLYQHLAGKNTVLMQNENIYEVLNASDAVIIKNSTTGLEAMLLGKPTIVFAKSILSTELFASTKAVLRARNQNELKEALKKVLNNGKARENLLRETAKFVEETSFKQDGKATQRVVKKIKSLVSD